MTPTSPISQPVYTANAFIASARNEVIGRVAATALVAVATAFASIYYLPPLAATVVVVTATAYLIKTIVQQQHSLNEILFEAGLKAWVKDPFVTGKKEDAARKILDAYKNKSTFLKLVGCNLSSLPPQIGQLTALVELNLTNNQLSSLPPEIYKLTALTHLDLRDNNLSSLQHEIGKLTSLKTLDLDELMRLICKFRVAERRVGYW